MVIVSSVIVTLGVAAIVFGLIKAFRSETSSGLAYAMICLPGGIVAICIAIALLLHPFPFVWTPGLGLRWFGCAAMAIGVITAFLRTNHSGSMFVSLIGGGLLCFLTGVAVWAFGWFQTHFNYTGG